MIGVILLGASIAIPVLILLWKEITGPLEQIGKHFRLIASLLTCVVIFMGYGRHLYRATSLEPHQKLVKAKTDAYLMEVQNAKKAKLLNKGEVAEAALMPGEAVFNANCKACHDVKEVIVGPSMLEAANIYKGNEPGLIAWIKAPGKKRDGPKMPPQAHLSATELKDVAAWILTLNAKPEAK
jgi:cytochrome c